MRRLLVLLLTGGLLAALTGCGAGPEPTGPPAPTTTSTGAPSMPPPSGTPPTEATPPPSTPPGAASPSSPAAGTSPPSPGELPGGLPFGERNLTGMVERSGDCTMLRVGKRLWGLTGTPVPGLRTGTEVAVSGQVTTPDPACGPEVARALVVHRATPV